VAKLTTFGFHALRETFRADDGAFVQAAHDDFVLVARFDLSDLANVNGHDLRDVMIFGVEDCSHAVAGELHDMYCTFIKSKKPLNMKFSGWGNFSPSVQFLSSPSAWSLVAR
jgi:hypothetical protein